MDMRAPILGLTAFLLFAAVLATYGLMAIQYPVAYIWATYEDLYGEWAQTYFFLLAALFSGAVARYRSQHRWFFVVLAVACFYVVMEEISWGQRIFGFETPDLLKRHNLQHETNIHNMFTGPVNTWTKRLLEYLLAAAFVGYGLVYPLLMRWRSGTRPLVWVSHWLPAPPLYLWPFFVTSAFLELGYLDFNEAEIAEILIGAALAMLSASYWWTLRHGSHTQNPVSLPETSAPGLSILFLAAFLLVGLLSGVTTQLLYRNPINKADTDSRLLNGYEKFADRYARYDRWPQAVSLYSMVHHAEPARTSVMRRLADAHRNNGDIAGFNRYNQMSLNTLLATQATNPTKVSTNLALYFTYRQRGVMSKALEHLRRAHELAKQRYALDPGRASNAYWLAKTYKELGDRGNAVSHYRRAFELEPTSKKYRKAYFAMKAYEAGDDD